MKKLVVASVLAIASGTAAVAATPQAPVNREDTNFTRVAANCGRGFWPGPGGHCYPMVHGGTCPDGFHVQGRRCWPNP